MGRSRSVSGQTYDPGGRQVKQQQGQIHRQRGHYRLQHADDQRLFPDAPQLGKTKLIADGKGDKAQRHIRQQAQLPQLLEA